MKSILFETWKPISVFNSVEMSDNEMKTKETNNTTYELRFLELEAGYRWHEESLKTVEYLSKQLTEVKKSLVRIFRVFSDFHNCSYIYIYKPKIKRKELIGRSAPSTSKLDQVKKELRSLTSLHGFSNILNTSNPFVKGLWLCFVLVLFSFPLQNVQENMSEYYQYTVITKIESLNESPMTLPAITLCLTSLNGSFSTTDATLDTYLYNCLISRTECGNKDFYSFRTRLRMNITNKDATCYVLNGGRNSTGHSKETLDLFFGFIYQRTPFYFIILAMLL